MKTINKQNLWFITLFSLILVLSIYYLTMSDDILNKTTNSNEEATPVVSLEESETLTALRVADDEEVLQEMGVLQEILLDENKTTEEKNVAYDSLKELNLNKGKEQTLEEKILKEFDLDSFVKIKNDQVKIVVASTKHDNELANKIIRSIQSQFDKQMYITVQFKV